MTKYRCIDIVLNIIGGIAVVFVGLEFLLFRIFPETFHQGFIICPTITGHVPNFAAGILILACSVFIFIGYWPSFFVLLTGSTFFCIMDSYWYLKTMTIDRFWPGMIGGIIGGAYFLCKLVVRGKLKNKGKAGVLPPNMV